MEVHWGGGGGGGGGGRECNNHTNFENFTASSFAILSVRSGVWLQALLQHTHTHTLTHTHTHTHTRTHTHTLTQLDLVHSAVDLIRQHGSHLSLNDVSAVLLKGVSESPSALVPRLPQREGKKQHSSSLSAVGWCDG